MSKAEQKLDEAIRLLDEMDSTSLGAVNRKLDLISAAVVAAKVALILERKKEPTQ